VTLSVTEDHGTRYELTLRLRRTQLADAEDPHAVLAESEAPPE
jgi:hypothetical protein